jgi:hypothetical protein
MSLAGNPRSEDDSHAGECPWQRFAALSMEERGKFQSETLSNVDAIKRAGGTAAGASGVTNEFIVVTLLVACDGTAQAPGMRKKGLTNKDVCALVSWRRSLPAVRWLRSPPQARRALCVRNVRFCRYRFPATDLNSKATWFGIQ